MSGRGALPTWHRIPAFSLSRGWGEGQEGEEKRKQEKGKASRALLSNCLHIVFLRDMPRRARDMPGRIGGKSPFALQNREIRRTQ